MGNIISAMPPSTLPYQLGHFEGNCRHHSISYISTPMWISKRYALKKCHNHNTISTQKVNNKTIIPYYPVSIQTSLIILILSLSLSSLYIPSDSLRLTCFLIKPLLPRSVLHTGSPSHLLRDSVSRCKMGSCGNLFGTQARTTQECQGFNILWGKLWPRDWETMDNYFCYGVQGLLRVFYSRTRCGWQVVLFICSK